MCQRRGNDGIYSLPLHQLLHWQFVVQDLQHMVVISVLVYQIFKTIHTLFTFVSA